MREVIHVSKPYKLVTRDFHPERLGGDVGGVARGRRLEPVIIAGPCTVESGRRCSLTARAVKAAGAGMLRGGAFKPRTGPHSFQGLGDEGLKLPAPGRRCGRACRSSPRSCASISWSRWPPLADVLQIGARNMQNFDLLKEVGPRSQARCCSSAA